MTFVLLTAGCGLLALAVVDVVWTTLAAGSGAGPVTGRVTDGLWRAALAVHRRRGTHRLLQITGVVIVVAVLVTWIVLALTGWSLVFFAAEGAVRVTDTGAPAAAVERLYFVGFTVFTLGLGDMRPGSGLWQLATVLASGTGLVLVTLALTFLMPVIGGASQRRQLAGQIHALGDSPQTIVIHAWTGSGFGYLADHFVALTSMVLESRQAHLSYPILHYLHTPDRREAAPVNLANLSGAVHLLRHEVAPDVRPDPVVLRALDTALVAFLEVVSGTHVTARPPVALPGSAALDRAGIPLVPTTSAPTAGDGEVGEDEERRGRLAGLLHEDGWEPGEASGRGPGD